MAEAVIEGIEDRKMAEEMVYEEAEVTEIFTFTPEDDSSPEDHSTPEGDSTAGDDSPTEVKEGS
jgi:hypothetical protein